MHAKWIHSRNTDPGKTQITWYRKILNLKSKMTHFDMKISAVSKYKLYVNGKPVSFGPTKGDDKIWFFDELSLDLPEGRNVVSAAVLHYPDRRETGNRSIFRSETPGLYIQSIPKLLNTDESWETYDAKQVRIIEENPFFSPLYIYEKAAGIPDLNDGCGACNAAVPYLKDDLEQRFQPEVLQKRRIPPLFLDPAETLVSHIKVPAHSHREIVLDAGEEICAFLSIAVSKGKGAEIRMLEAESYVYHVPDPPKDYSDLPEKGDRTDAAHGELSGFKDCYTAAGYGTKEHPERYEPFWFRTYRFIRVTIDTKDQELCLLSVEQRRTGYPLKVKTKIKVSDPDFMEIWDMSLRTLKRCMLETYVDCPFYEQLQYAMDARSEMRYTYAVSGDDRLARQCIDDFARCQNEDGVMNCSYPDVGTNIIPGFNIYVIGMLYDHMMYFGDRKLIQKYFPVAERVLEYFHRHLNGDGIVEKIGGPGFRGGVWSFIDWTKEWDQTRGVPAATMNGPIAMESLLYSYGLRMTEKMAGFLEENEKAEILHVKRMKLNEAIRKQYLGREGLIKDGPGTELYSQHCQVFAALTDLLPKEQLAENLKKTLDRPSEFSQCSVAMMPYLFSALKKTNQYERTKKLWDTWKGMLRNHLTTCAEDGLSSRSDCHGWGALILYELPAVILGVHPVRPGFEKYEVKPVKGYFDWVEGEIITPVGMIKVSDQKESGGKEESL